MKITNTRESQYTEQHHRKIKYRQVLSCRQCSHKPGVMIWAAEGHIDENARERGTAALIRLSPKQAIDFGRALLADGAKARERARDIKHTKGAQQ